MIGNRPSARSTRPLKTRKLVIKPLKRQLSLPDGFEETTWKKLSEAVDAVHNMTTVAYSREELYHGVEDLCRHKMAASTYDKLRTKCETHIGKLVSALVGHMHDHEALLTAMQEAWANHCRQTTTIRSIFLYLDRTYALQTTGVKSLWDLGLHLFRQSFEGHDELVRKVVAALLHQIERERNGETVDKSLLSSVTRMFSLLGVYERFELPFLDQSVVFYKAEGLHYMQSADVPKYLLHVEKRFVEEAARGFAYLDIRTRRPLTEVLEAQLVLAHVTGLLEKGFEGLADGARVDDLRRMYALLSRIGRAADINTYFRTYATSKGMAIAADATKDKSMAQSLLDLREALLSLVASAFSNNESFQASIKATFEKVVNSRGSRPAELIAKFIDSKLRSGSKAGTEDEVDLLLDKVMSLFRAIHAKDVFEAFYKKDLAKRLLLGKSASTELERSMLSKLKTECGSAFTAKLEGMFNDMKLSKEFWDQYQSRAAAATAAAAAMDDGEDGDDGGAGAGAGAGASAGAGAGAIAKVAPDCMVYVLTTTNWPNYPPMELVLPPVLQVPQDDFRTFYLGKYHGKRKLTWQHSLGQCTLRGFFPAGRKELSVSLFQTLVLLLFNTKDEWAFKDIKTETGIEDGELRRTLISLACGKVRVILKQPKGRDVNDDDKFVFNAGFKAKLMRIKINSIQMKETKEEAAETHERVFRDRQYQVDAAIVRTMKTRKQLSHQLLISELFGQLKFPAKASDLKKRIESLIDREYIERDETDPALYHYVA